MNLERLKDRIRHSGDFTALEKRYLEERIEGEPMKHGKWKDYPSCWGCSQCGRTVSKKYISLPVIECYRFCPYCGAKMEGSEKNGEA